MVCTVHASPFRSCVNALLNAGMYSWIAVAYAWKSKKWNKVRDDWTMPVLVSMRMRIHTHTMLLWVTHTHNNTNTEDAKVVIIESVCICAAKQMVTLHRTNWTTVRCEWLMNRVWAVRCKTVCWIHGCTMLKCEPAAAGQGVLKK